MSYCTDCIHYKVCGNEGVDDSAMTFCADKQTNGDLISRQAVLDLAKDLTFEGGCKHRCVDVIKIYELPSAEKTAEWRIVGKTTLHYECSKCGGAGDEWDKFCKHCGRRMKGVDDE